MTGPRSTVQQRDEVRRCVEEMKNCVRCEMSPDVNMSLGCEDRAAVARSTVRRALESLGYLVVRRRRGLFRQSRPLYMTTLGEGYIRRTPMVSRTGLVVVGACLMLSGGCRSCLGVRDLEKERSVDFQVDVRVAERDLVVQYTVINHAERDLYLLNRLYRSTPEWTITPDIVYVELEPTNRVVLLSKKLADLPEGVSVTMPVAPFVSPVRGMTSFTEEVRIPIPVQQYRQYSITSRPAAAALKTYDYVDLTIGYYWRPPDTTEEVRQVQGTAVIIPHTPAGARLEFGLLQQRHATKVRVLEPAS
jgi:hypothetical protein